MSDQHWVLRQMGRLVLMSSVLGVGVLGPSASEASEKGKPNSGLLSRLGSLSVNYEKGVGTVDFEGTQWTTKAVVGTSQFKIGPRFSERFTEFVAGMMGLHLGDTTNGRRVLIGTRTRASWLGKLFPRVSVGGSVVGGLPQTREKGGVSGRALGALIKGTSWLVTRGGKRPLHMRSAPALPHKP